jgi:hypothetical protein
MPIPYISDLDDDALLQEYHRSIKRLRSLDRTAPAWARDIRLMYHDYLADELTARRLSIEQAPSRAQAANVGDASMFDRVPSGA